MRILHVISTADPRTGGPIEGIRQRGELLVKMGHQVEVATGDAPDADFVANFPLPIYACGPSKSGLAYAPGLGKWLDENVKNYDALVANGIWQYPNLALRAAAKKAGMPYWIFPHGMLDPYFNRFLVKRIKKTLYWPWQHAALRDAEAVLFTCEEERLLARKAFKPYNVRERVVNYGTGGPPDDAENQRAAFAAAFPALEGKRYLLFLSRIHPKKGVDLLLTAFDKFAKQDPEIHLALAGPVDDAYRAELEKLIAGSPVASRVHWLGMVRNDVKWGSFRAAEAFILPSHQENFGISVVEALAAGTPVLITRPINIWREIEADGAGIVGEDTLPGVEEILAKWHATSPEDRAEMGRQARICFLNRFTVQKSADSLLAAIGELRAK